MKNTPPGSTRSSLVSYQTSGLYSRKADFCLYDKIDCSWRGSFVAIVQARRQGVRGVRTHPPPPKSQKAPPDGIVKYLK